MEAKQRIWVSFSGGKSSAYMAVRLLREYGHLYDFVSVFANTGQEREETLLFIKRCDEVFGLNIVWVEADVRNGREGTKHRVVDFATANRDGAVFEEVIKKYGIPNKAYPHCTRELKLAPMYDYVKRIGWKGARVAIGIRADEPKRLRKDAEAVSIVYPMAHWFPSDKQDVNQWWEDQSFNLNLQEHQGNCSWCWKKSQAKRFKLLEETPEIFEFPKRMESLYSDNRPERGSQFFFRGNTSTAKLIALKQELGVPPSVREDEDASGGCGESCDINNYIESLC